MVHASCLGGVNPSETVHTTRSPVFTTPGVDCRANSQHKSYSIVVSSKFLEACATPNCNVARYIIQRYLQFQSSKLRLGSAYLQPRSRDPLALSSSCPPRAKRVATLFLKVAETLTPNAAFNSKVALASMGMLLS